MAIINNFADALHQAIGQPSLIMNANTKSGIAPFQLWCYAPPSRVSMEDTAVYTVGLSDSPQGGACPYAEVAFQIKGVFEDEKMGRLSQAVGGIVHMIRKYSRIHPNLLVRNSPVAMMPKMKNLLFVDGAGSRPLWIEAKDKNVRVLNMIPLLEEEARFTAPRSGFNTYWAFLNQKINFMDPTRKPLEEFDISLTGFRLSRVLDLSNPELSQTLGEIWEQIQRWYELNAPNIFDQQSGEIPEKPEEMGRQLGLFENEIPTETLTEAELATFYLNHLERLYAGAYLPGESESLLSNPFFPPPVKSGFKY